MSPQSYRDLQAWQSAMELAAGVHRLARALPESEQLVLANDMHRAAIRVVSNIVDGHSQREDDLREYRDHLDAARGALAAVETYMLLVKDLGFAPASRIEPLEGLAETVRRQVDSLWGSLSIRLHDEPSPFDDPLR